VPAMLSRRVLRWSQGAAASAGAVLGLTVSDGPKPVAHAAAGGSLARISYGQREAAISCAETEPGLAHFLPDQASPQVQQIAAKCRYYSPAFSPKDVPAFYDLSGITEDAAVFQRTVDLFVHRYQEQIERGCGPTVVVGYDARGFVLGPPVALALKVTSLQPAAAASTAQHSQPASQPVPAVLRREVCRWLPPPSPSHASAGDRSRSCCSAKRARIQGRSWSPQHIRRSMRSTSRTGCVCDWAQWWRATVSCSSTTSSPPVEQARC
jgi:hypothetical protein